MDITQSLSLLAGLTPQQFMKRHWQKKPLLVRQAIPDFQPLLPRAALFDLAGQEGVESRLLIDGDPGWSLRHGPFTRRSLPPLSRPRWSLLVQGVDLHHDGVHQLLQQFRFVPDARLDDVMISYASDAGGVGPHYDSYDVFLLQASGQRRWRIGRQKDLSLVEGLPLKILANFEPEEEYILNPGDMLYLPPLWAHDGVALGGDCMTYSVGFRQPNRGELAAELLGRLAEEAGILVGEGAYRDPRQPAVEHPGQVPQAMLDFAQDAIFRALKDPSALAMLLGEWLTEPKPNVWFEAQANADECDRQDALTRANAVVLDRRSRMMHDPQHIFINGEGYSAAGRDARLMRLLADHRKLHHKELRQLGDEARELLCDWIAAGWAHLEN